MSPKKRPDSGRPKKRGKPSSADAKPAAKPKAGKDGPDEKAAAAPEPVLSPPAPKLVVKSGKGAGRRGREADADGDAPVGADPASETPPEQQFPVVGVGASAGGLEAFSQLLQDLPERTGMAYVLVQHLSPTHESALSEILATATKMPVQEVTDGLVIERDHVYVMPPNVDMAIHHGRLQLLHRTAGRGRHLPVDFFFRALAEDRKHLAIGIILSGTASDGTQGMKTIKAEGGITIAQDPATAKYDGMPRAAISAGAADLVLPLQGIAAELSKLGRHPYVNLFRPADPLPEGDDQLNKVFFLLRGRTGVDFTYYKHPTIKRRLKRRMVLNKIEQLEDYVKLLQGTPAEVDALYQDILIHVTSFFREPDTFEALKNEVFAHVLKRREADAPVRIWVPGCSTGEEAYSLAIVLLEHLGDMANNTPIQIFATDISDSAVEKARNGFYSEDIAEKVSPGRLRRFFAKADGGYRISKSIRDICVFARQDVTKDPPFSRLDLISCRNVLIYLGPVLQKRVMTFFHYALKPGGYLLLGNSETIGSYSDLFSLTDKKHKIYLKKATAARSAVELPAAYPVQHLDAAKRPAAAARAPSELQSEVDRLLLNEFSPAGVVVNDDLQIVQFRGHTGAYLEPAPGEASLNLLKMAREGLMMELRTAVHTAKSSGGRVRKDGVRVKRNGDTRSVAIEVIPIKPRNDVRHFLVLFRDQPAAPGAHAPEHARPKAGAPGEAERLEQELVATREYLQSIIQDQEASNEELQSANEEILSANEELQSTNEELETAKEELQSANEELNTLNEELQNRNGELTSVNSDLVNLLGSVQLPIVMVGSDLRVRRFTPMAEKMFNLIPTDVGRPIGDIKPNFDVQHLEKMITETVDTVSAKELDVQDGKKRWFSLRVRPYKTVDNKIDGAVITLVDIDSVKRAEQARGGEGFLRPLLETAREPFAILDSELRIRYANQPFRRAFQLGDAGLDNKPVCDVIDGGREVTALRRLLEETLRRDGRVHDAEIRHEFQLGGTKLLRVNAHRLDGAGDGSASVILSLTAADGGKLSPG